MTDSLQLDSTNLSDFFWEMVKNTTKYSVESIKKILRSINDITLSSTSQNSDIEMKDEDDEKAFELSPSVCVFFHKNKTNNSTKNLQFVILFCFHLL